jgi:hypothetical protein
VSIFYNSVGVQAPTELQALRACCLIKARFEIYIKQAAKTTKIFAGVLNKICSCK